MSHREDTGPLVPVLTALDWLAIALAIMGPTLALILIAATR